MMSQSSSEISLQEVTLNPIGDMEQRPPIVPKLAWVEEEEGPGAAPEEQPAEVEQFQLPQEDAALDRTQEQDGAHGRFRRAAQEETSIVGTGSMENCDVYSTDTSAAMLDLLVQRSVSVAKQVPAMVRDIHQWLMANESDEQSLDRTLLELAEAHPADVGITLLRVAPSCDRYGAHLPTGLTSPSPCGACPRCLTNRESRALWLLHFPALACQPPSLLPCSLPQAPSGASSYRVFFSTVEMTEKVDNLWRLCQEEHGLVTNPSRFAVQTLKVLLCRLEYEHVVVAVQCKRGWDALLCADTHPYAVALLARGSRHRGTAELTRKGRERRVPRSSRLPEGTSPLAGWSGKKDETSIARHLLELLSRVEPKWDLPALAFLVEVLKCLDLRECGDSVVEISSKYLQSERRQMRRLALRALLVLRGDPSVVRRGQRLKLRWHPLCSTRAERTWSLTESLVKLLRENASDVVGMSIIVLSSVLTYNGAPIPHPIALQLAEALLPLFDNDDSQVQLLSMSVFRTLMSLVAEEGEKPLKTQVCRSLVPLFFHCHDENRHVAEASQGTLLCVAKFLKRKDFEKPLKKQQLWKFAECLLAEDRSRVARHLYQAINYVDSPQESLREAAVGFIEIAARRLRRQSSDFRFIWLALEHMRRDVSPAIRSLALQTLFALGIADTGPYPLVQRLQDQLRRAWETRPRLPGLGCLRFWSSVWR
ncbi:uncharacterized protein LOC125328547 [Corvus hawaiiensis]|uniref:uncharacterized protein LOC125328547 n=1 Tax=Corvus hawaiiensis TaxID=134902 RepID=UPI00201A198A|nr:uncharacterized protein LOC125328547 [Corvus hawaiiensis]